MSQFALKLIALLAMLLDHTVKVVLKSGTLSPYLGVAGEAQFRTMLLVLGRLAFPMFAWFAAEGCRYAKSREKHLLRLLIFGILSEVPFQLCFRRTLSLGDHNVMFTLLLAVAAIYGAVWLEQRGVQKPWAQIISAAVSIYLGWVLKTDYNAWGVALVLGFYYMPETRERLIYGGVWVTLFQLLWHGYRNGSLVWLRPEGYIYLLYWLGELCALMLLAAYNGRRGPRGKWLFYWFYPLHLGLLYAAAQMLRP